LTSKELSQIHKFIKITLKAAIIKSARVLKSLLAKSVKVVLTDVSAILFNYFWKTTIFKAPESISLKL